MNTLLIIIHVIVCVFIILIVLLQVGRGAEAGAMFGGSGQANSMRGQTTFIGKLTTGMAVAFMITSFLLTYDTSNNAKSSVIEMVTEEEAPRPVETKTESSTESSSTQKTAADTSSTQDTSQ